MPIFLRNFSGTLGWEWPQSMSRANFLVPKFSRPGPTRRRPAREMGPAEFGPDFGKKKVYCGGPGVTAWPAWQPLARPMDLAPAIGLGPRTVFLNWSFFNRPNGSWLSCCWPHYRLILKNPFFHFMQRPVALLPARSNFF